MSSTLDRLTAEAKRVLNDVWNLSPGSSALVAHRWFKSANGFEAFSAFALQMNSAQTGTAQALAMEIFALRVEIASRRAGWHIELESPVTPRDLAY